MIPVTHTIRLNENEIEFKFIRSSGPGGQHVNKTSTGVQLRFDVKKSESLPNSLRQRLQRIAGNRINSAGILVISANRFRSQDLNRKDALDRLAELIEQAASRTKPRHRTKPTSASVRKRKETKKRRSRLKHSRKRVSWNDE